ncbi:MAG: hypothetical protein ACOCRC_04595, partial [Halodesulfurarchaeum sp.]
TILSTPVTGGSPPPFIPSFITARERKRRFLGFFPFWSGKTPVDVAIRSIRRGTSSRSKSGPVLRDGCNQPGQSGELPSGSNRKHGPRDKNKWSAVLFGIV